MKSIIKNWNLFLKESKAEAVDQDSDSADEIYSKHPETAAMAHHYHRKQVRRSSGDPYVVHPKEVAAIIKKYYQSDASVSQAELKNMINIALLHDTIEDAHKNLPGDLERSKRKLDTLFAQNLISQESYNRRIEQINQDAELYVSHDIIDSHGMSIYSDILSLSHDDNMTYSQYVSSLSSDPVLIRIKLADMLHNASDLKQPENWSNNQECDPAAKGWVKYRCALLLLINDHGGKPDSISSSHWDALKKVFNL